MNPKEFEYFYRNKRNESFINAYDLAYKSFIDLGYDKKAKNYFIENASEIVLSLRSQSWENFLIAEKEFSSNMYKHLANSENYTGLQNKEAVYQFIDNNTQHFYDLSLSNTQSRRSRAGKEFEAIIELIIMGAELSIDSQGSLASGIFESHNLGKAVDLVSPGVAEYEIQKRQVSLISCKTTLRERWAEVIEEKTRTGASEIFLATLDEKISTTTIQNLTANNVIPVTTTENISKNYVQNTAILCFEDLLEELNVKSDYWNKQNSNKRYLEEKLTYINEQKEYHKESHPFVYEYYTKQEKKLIN